MDITWQWLVNQSFAVLALVFVAISFQQKTTKKLILIRSIASWLVFIGLCFLGNISVIIMCGAGILRNAVSLFFAYKPNSKNSIKYFSSIVIIILLVTLNIFFWVNYFNWFSIVIGTFNVFTFMQQKPARIRICAVFGEILAIVYYSLLLTPINAVIEVIGLISIIIGIIRHDRKTHIANSTEGVS